MIDNTMKKFQRWLRQRTDELDELYSLPDPNEDVWRRSACIVEEAGDRAARLGLADLFQRSGKIGFYTEPEIAKAFLSECLAALRPTPAPAAADEMLNLKQAAAYLGYGSRGLREIVDRTRKSRARQHVVGPTIEFSQGGKGGTILFRREWLDDFIEANRVRPATLPPTPKARKRAAKPGTEMAAAWNALARQ